MSEEINAQLKTECEQYKLNQKGLIAQLEAHKSFLNDTLASSLQLRTSLVMFQQANQEHCVEIASLKTENNALKDQVLKQGQDNQALRDKIAELEALKPEGDVPPPV